MPRMKIFSDVEKNVFDNPPIFNHAERKQFFDLSPGVVGMVDTIRTPTNKACFLVTFGYFKAARKFFARKIHPIDVTYVARKLEIPVNQIHTDRYDEGTYRRHQKIILAYFGFQSFDREAEEIIVKEIEMMVRSQLKPKLILLHTLDILKRKKQAISPKTEKITLI